MLNNPNKSNFIAGIFDYQSFSKKAIRENIENGFFDRIASSVEFYADEIVALFTCLRFEVYVFVRDKEKIKEIRKILNDNKFRVLDNKKEITEYLVRLVSGDSSEIRAETQIEKQVTNAFESQLDQGAELMELCRATLKKAASFRKKNNFYNYENYATIAFRILGDLVKEDVKELLIVGTGIMAKEFMKACSTRKEKFDKIFIMGRDRQKAKKLKDDLSFVNAEAVTTQQMDNVINKVDVAFAAAGGKYKIKKYSKPLLIIDITCPSIFTLDECSRTKMITMYDKIYEDKIKEVNGAFKGKLN